MRRPRPQLLPSGKFRLQIQRAGWPRIDRADFPTEADAEAEIDRLLGLYGKPKTGKTTLRDAWADYLLSDTYDGKAVETRSTELRVSAHWLPRFGDLTLENAVANPQLYVQYRKERLTQRYKPGKNTPERTYGKNQVRLELASLSSLFNYAREQGWIATNPILGIKRPYKRGERRRVPCEEFGRLGLGLVNAAYSEEDRERCRFFVLMQELGCRPGELSGLLKSNLDLRAGVLHFLDTKNGEDRGVPLSDWQKEEFSRQLVHALVKDGDESPYVFSTWSAKNKVWVQYGYSAAWKRLKKLGLVNAEDKTRPHDRRHEHISSAIEQGHSYDQIKLLTGHRSMQAFNRYNHAQATAKAARERVRARGGENLTTAVTAMIEALDNIGDNEARSAIARLSAMLNQKLSTGGQNGQ